MVVHRALGDFGPCRDAVHAGDLETVVAEFGNRRLHNGFTFSVGQSQGS
nr:hypothetical protein [Tanacetum cinerariifolium]